MKRKLNLFDDDNGAYRDRGARRSNQENTDSDSDSDAKIIFTTQANKKRKMSGDDALKLWFSKELQN